MSNLEKNCCSTGADYEKRVQRLVEAARAVAWAAACDDVWMAYGDLLKAIEEVEHE